MDKAKRQAIVKRLIMEYDIASQNELMEKLAEENIQVAQATISRDIRELNIVKRHDSNGNLYYRLLNNSVLGIKKRTDEERLIHAVAETGVSLTQVEFTNILTVLPGNGQVVGVLIDSIRTSYTKIIGCIAGDDTILILSKDRKDAEEVHRYFKKYLFFN
ncbi:arginine repressor [Vagococcus fluvialis]|uniref:arginine repressor n=1 Tax=Vagococcus fluvialis TaxID=2738 RepID=UPI001432A4AF|nr:ArgR family transcriptional regulator [Vagococcus fluvialis]MBO0444571.1 ArgR family transcriptional regulator [Vagococcus fluvialis]MBO0488316.1 ArgR family transcriptional regulator [Vagococcus fluvialis]MCM2140126.1 ArgR family transcriptional regulator [Vagococcus fluvialis]MDT2746982.1 ArgR family transcriptional regulator [Vagococcus fluvialis]NKC60811.1 ArgR family transcriptional regulator [Vagococcus fluvialis]